MRGWTMVAACGAALAGCAGPAGLDPDVNGVLFVIGGARELPVREFTITAARRADDTLDLFLQSHHEEVPDADDGVTHATMVTDLDLRLEQLDGPDPYDHLSQSPTFHLFYRRDAVFPDGSLGEFEECVAATHFPGSAQDGTAEISFGRWAPEEGVVTAHVAFTAACDSDIGVIQPDGTIDFNVVDLEIIAAP